jgi:hypothetical protein
MLTLAFFLVSVNLIVSTADAETSVSGIVTTTTWTADNSPYRVLDTLTVPAGITLTIDAGVDVLFDADVPMFVEGRMRAYGTVDDSIRFVGTDIVGWGGIMIIGADTVMMRYCRVSDGRLHETSLRGAGVFVNQNAGGHVRMAHTVLSDNVALIADAYPYVPEGGGIAFLSSHGTSAILDTCSIVGNSTEYGGGGIHVASPDITLNHCLIANNKGSLGAGVYHEGGTLLLNRCVIRDNTGINGGLGLGVYSWGPWHVRTILENCTVVGNQGEGLYLDASHATVRNTIIWGNSLDGISYGVGMEPDTLVASYSILQGADDLPGDFTSDVNPQFVDYTNRDLRLLPTSPCIDTGDPATALDADGSRADIGAFGFNGAETPSLLIETTDVVPGDTLKLVVRGRFAEANSIELGLQIDPDVFMPVFPFIDTSTMRSFAADFVNDTVRVALSNQDPVTLLGDTLVVLSFRLPSGALGDTTVSVRWVESSTAVAGEQNATLVDGLVHVGTRPVSVTGSRPTVYALEQNSPNPFNPSTTIGFTIPEAGSVRLDVYNSAGQIVTTLIDRWIHPGRHAVVWSGTDAFGRLVASGVYIVRMTSDDFQAVGKVSLLR